ncbi:MAG: ribokinase [Treponema sp.]|nr:ribokinase [Treponema sp.]
MKVLVFGSINIDLVFSVDHIVVPGETISSSALVKSAGGKGANQAAALAKAGMQVYMAGKIGQDGQFILTLLESYGVDTGRVLQYDGASGQALIQLDKNKQNSIILFSGGNGAITPEEIAPAMAGFSSGDMIVLQNEIVYLKEIMECAKKQGLRICLNPSPFNSKITELPLDIADIFFINEIEGAALAELPPGTPLDEVLEKLVARFPNAEIILTAGKDGAYYGYKDIRKKSDIVDVPVVDTVGAGDAFTGYFIAAREKQLPVDQALEAACKAAAITVSRKGALESIPHYREVGVY